jgi:Universal stress protein family
MYKKILVPLDGSKTAENVLPYARCFARNLQIPVELLTVVDLSELTRNVSAAEGLFLDTLIDDETRRYDDYLKGIAKNFPTGSVQYRVGKGKAAEVIVESAGEGKGNADRPGDSRSLGAQPVAGRQCRGKSSTSGDKSIVIGTGEGGNPAVEHGGAKTS